MDPEKLSNAFLQIEKKFNLKGYLKKICDEITLKTISRKRIEDLLKSENINYSIAKVAFLHLIFAYIVIALEDNILTRTEKEDIKFLKLLFRIQPGDFYLHNKTDIEAALTFQLSKMYEDCYVTNEEALLKVDLQEIFDLSYDEMNGYAKNEAAFSVKNGADPRNLDILFTQKDFF